MGIIAWVIVAALGSSEARAQCAPTWDPENFAGPLAGVVTIAGEGGLGAAKNRNGAGRHGEDHADPWYIGFDANVVHTLGSPGLKVLFEGRYGRFFSIGSQHLNTSLWSLRGAVLAGPSRVQNDRPWQRVLSIDDQYYSGMGGNLVTEYSYCPETSGYRQSFGYGVGAEIDRLTGTPALTVNGLGIWEVSRSKQATMFELYGLYGPPMGLSNRKLGVGATVRMITDGSVAGAAVEGWSADGYGAFLVTGFIGGGGTM